MSGFSFPILSNQELLPCLKEMDLPLTAEQISKPTFEILQRIYEILVTTLLGVTREELQQPVFMAIDTLEYPELHDESIPTLAFIKSLNRLLVAAGIKDFNMQQDLYKPDSNRLRRNLSGIINFAKFREEKLVPYTDMQESVEHLLEETAELEELNMRL
ncbi:MAG: kinetochore Nuf2, partial [Trebouxia sp. A1-2]